MNVKFKIKNIYGEEKWWSPNFAEPGEDVLETKWRLGEDGRPVEQNVWSLGDGDKVFLCDVVEDYRSLCREEPLLTELIKIPTQTLYVKLLFQYWEELGDEWFKAFIYAYQENGIDFNNANELANKVVWTGVKFNGEEQEKSYENIGEYFAREYGFVDCLNEPEKLRETLRLADFGRAQEKRLGTRLQASVTFGEWLLVEEER